MVIRAGIVGVSEGNGHPFSFSAIVNGYTDAGLAGSGWPRIHDYMRRRHPSEIGIEGLRITHAWTQDPETSRKLCESCLIPHAVDRLEDLQGAVDAVIIARDDHESHRAMAEPFLESGTPVFVDKPLSLDPEDLRFFAPHLRAGRLMSCSGLRYARELDGARAALAEYGTMKLVRAAVVNSWDRYAVHGIDAVLSVVEARPVEVFPHAASHQSVAVRLDDGCLFLLDALGDVPVTFHFDFYGTDRISSHEVEDNFTMFRRMLWEFARMVETGAPPIPPDRTLDAMRVLVAGAAALAERRAVRIDELAL